MPCKLNSATLKARYDPKSHRPYRNNYQHCSIDINIIQAQTEHRPSHGTGSPLAADIALARQFSGESGVSNPLPSAVTSCQPCTTSSAGDPNDAASSEISKTDEATDQDKSKAVDNDDNGAAGVGRVKAKVMEKARAQKYS